FLERRFRRHLHLGDNPHPFRVGPRDRVDRACARNHDLELVVELVAPDGVRSTSRGLTDDLRSVKGLEVVRELLSAGERSLARENVDWFLATKPRAAKIADGPGFRRGVGVARERVALDRIRCFLMLHRAMNGRAALREAMACHSAPGYLVYWA